jgi:ABC-type sugar transport system substrate-binding protein
MRAIWVRTSIVVLVVALVSTGCSNAGGSAPVAASAAASAAASTAPSVSTASAAPSASTAAASASAAAASGSAAADMTKPPYTVQFPWGTFHLAPAIAAKVAAHEPINLFVEGQADGFPVISKQTRDGFQAAIPAAKAVYPFNYSYFAPPGNAYNEPLQIQQIRAQLDAGQIDCMVVAPTTSTGLNKLMSEMVDKGIPVFTFGVPTDLSGHDFANYAQVPLKEGVQAAHTLVDWMNKNNKQFTNFAVSSALPAEVWASGRMISFIKTMKELVPGANFINDDKSALNTTLDPATTYDKAKAFLQGNPTVQVVMNTDIGDQVIDKAIVDLGLKDKVYTIGWNPGKANLTYIKDGVEIATMDQNPGGLTALSLLGCTTFMAKGEVLPNNAELKPVTSENADEYLKLYQ